MSWEEASMTAAFCEQEDEEVGLTEKEMREEASVTPGWVGVSKPKGSARLSGKGGKKKTSQNKNFKKTQTGRFLNEIFLPLG